MKKDYKAPSCMVVICDAENMLQGTPTTNNVTGNKFQFSRERDSQNDESAINFLSDEQDSLW